MRASEVEDAENGVVTLARAAGATGSVAAARPIAMDAMTVSRVARRRELVGTRRRCLWTAGIGNDPGVRGPVPFASADGA